MKESKFICDNCGLEITEPNSGMIVFEDIKFKITTSKTTLPIIPVTKNREYHFCSLKCFEDYLIKDIEETTEKFDESGGNEW